MEAQCASIDAGACVEVRKQTMGDADRPIVEPEPSHGSPCARIHATVFAHPNDKRAFECAFGRSERSA